MLIQWFPGHMAKTLRVIEENLKLANAIIYCLDARAPFSSLNPKFEKIIGNKPVIFVLNKADLADEVMTKRAVKMLENEGKTVIVTNANSNACRGLITKTLAAAFKQKQEVFDRRGVTGVLRAMVIGVPNTGKSTIINLLAGEKKATTGDKAGVTKNANWIKVADNIEVIDTPGTLWPSFEDPSVGRNLAIIGSIKTEVLDISELGFETVKLLIDIAPDKLKERYKLSEDAGELAALDPIEIYDEICAKRGWILKRNEMDYERAGKGIIDDFRSARIGRITIDKF